MTNSGLLDKEKRTMDKRGYVAMNNVYAQVHLHASHGDCRTVCGFACDQVDTAYRGRDRERVTCQTCLGRTS